MGVVHPCDSGFVPSTIGPDGDPVDAFIFWDAATFPGVVIPCRALGLMQVEQNRAVNDSSVRIRNDRILAVPADSRREASLTSFDAVPLRVRDELVHFIVAATALEGKDVRFLGWDGPAAALAMLASATILS